MSTTQKKKLCWNCEGRVSFEEENCPYCSVYLSPVVNEAGQQDLLAPPYQIVEEEVQDVPESPYQTGDGDAENEVPELDEAKEGLRQVVLPMGMLSAGSLFFLFGLMLLIFSDKGTLTLSWNADYWYLYVLLSLPALLFGWLSLGSSES